MIRLSKGHQESRLPSSADVLLASACLCRFQIKGDKQDAANGSTMTGNGLH